MLPISRVRRGSSPGIGDGDVNDASAPRAHRRAPARRACDAIGAAPHGRLRSAAATAAARAGGMRRPAVPDPPRRHLAVSRQPDQPQGTGLPVRQRAAARGGRVASGCRRPAERGRIEVEDAPFVAVELDWTGDGRQQVLSFRTNVDQVITAGPDHPIRVAHDILTCEPTPYLLVRPGAGRLRASRRGSIARCITSWWRWRCRNGSAAAACWASGAAASSFPWASCRAGEE